MIAFLSAFVVAVVGVGAVGASLVGLVLWGKKAHERRLAIWGHVAARHGLTFHGSSIHGTKYGQHLHVGAVTRGSGKSRQTYTVVSARLPLALDLGLNVRRHGFLSDMFHSAKDIVLGDPPFDSRFLVSADEDHRARAVLTPPLRRLLLERLGQNTFHLNDAGMTVECRGATSDERWLDWAIEICARAASKIDRARAHTPVATPLAAHRQAWRTYAEACGLRGQDTPLCMWGRLEHYDVSVQSVRVDRLRHALQISVRFPASLGIGLSIKETGMLDSVAVFFGGEDHQLGDPVFDRTFRIKTSEPDRASEILDETVQRELLAVRAALGPPIVDDHGISVRLPTIWGEPAAVPRVVHQLTGLAERLSARGRPATVGPYR